LADVWTDLSDKSQKSRLKDGGKNSDQTLKDLKEYFSFVHLLCQIECCDVWFVQWLWYVCCQVTTFFSSSRQFTRWC